MIQPVKLNNSSISQIHNIKQKVLLPIVTLPLVAYMNPPKIRTRERNKLIDKEQIHISKPVTERTKYNTEQLKKLGYKDKDIEKMLKTDGHLTEE